MNNCSEVFFFCSYFKRTNNWSLSLRNFATDFKQRSFLVNGGILHTVSLFCPTQIKEYANCLKISVVFPTNFTRRMFTTISKPFCRRQRNRRNKKREQSSRNLSRNWRKVEAKWSKMRISFPRRRPQRIKYRKKGARKQPRRTRTNDSGSDSEEEAFAKNVKENVPPVSRPRRSTTASKKTTEESTSEDEVQENVESSQPDSEEEVFVTKKNTRIAKSARKSSRKK